MPFLEAPIQTDSTFLLTDSRQVSQPDKSIFFAIKGENHDGHQFIQELYEKGVREFVLEKSQISHLESHISHLKDAKIWVVQNSIKALQQLVANRREKFNYPVIGITGSNGKTIVKEWLSTLLSGGVSMASYNVVKSPRSYNSQIGVPLSVWQMNELNNIGVFEAGISKSGEMENLEPVIRPKIGIFTNIGSAHDEGFRSLKQKTTEKLRLFRRSKCLIYCKDYDEIDEEIRILLKAVNPKIELIGWSRKQLGTIWVEVKKERSISNLEIFFSGEEYVFQLPFTDDASIENATHCIFAMLYLKIDANEINDRLRLLKSVAMRLELKQGINDCYLIDDTYNNDLAGLSVALNFMSQQQSKNHKVLIISDLLQSGLRENELYKQIAELIKGKQIDELIGIGKVISQHSNLFDLTANFYINTNEFLEKHPIQNFRQSLILVKGARSFSFEKIINRLIQKVHGTVFEINLDALTHNLNFYRQKVGSATKIMVMVKAYAYGSGSSEVASLLEYHRVDYLGVAYPDEGITLRKSGIKLPIMVLNASPETFDKLIEHNLEPEIYSFRILEEWLNYLKKNPPLGLRSIHLKLDTGMHRLGFLENEIDKLLLILSENPAIRVASIFSHLVGADEAIHNDFSKNQVEVFERMSKKIMQNFGGRSADYQPIRHICNSAGIIRFPEAKFDMVRLGIGLYGFEATGQEQNALQTVGTLKTTISQIKTLKAGETVGYSRNGILEKDSRIATISIGYADGFDRGFGKGVGKVLVNGVRCPTVGNVCMDMTMIDVTETKCEEGDEVIIFGKNLTINELAKSIGTIPYEILTGVSERVKRVFYKE